jgi:NAD+ synthase
MELKLFGQYLKESIENIENDVNEIATWLKQYCDQSGSKGYVIGLSGGVDSSASCGLAITAVGKENVLGVLLPSIVEYKDDLGDGKRVANHYGIKYVIHPIKSTVESIIKEHSGELTPLAIGNIQARIRMTLLRMYAESNNYLVLGTTNKSEDMVGYFTKAGDGGHGVDIEPLAEYYKSEIREFARYFELPDDLVNRKPSAGLVKNLTDEDELGFTYKDFEDYWKWKVNKTGDCPVTEEIINKIERLKKRTEHKRNLPPNFGRVTIPTRQIKMFGEVEDTIRRNKEDKIKSFKEVV